MNHVQLHQRFILRHRDKRDGTLLLDPVGDLLNLFAALMAGRSPANEHSNLSVLDFMQKNKLPACTFVMFPPPPLFFI